MKIDCSKTDNFLNEMKRMCVYFKHCSKCPIEENGLGCSPENFDEKLIEIVQKWSDENPVETRQDCFLNLFPKAYVYEGLLTICPRDLNREYDCDSECKDCRMKYWSQPNDFEVNG